MPTPVPVAPNRGEARPKQSTMYNLIMTPVLFVSFLISLAWVDFRYSIQRSHNHAEEPSRLPHWLHHIVYRAAPYRSVKLVKPGSSRPGSPAATDGAGDEGKGFYYHSKQRKLMKMEAEEAFEVRRSVVVFLTLLAVAASWGAWRMTCWVWRKLLRT